MRAGRFLGRREASGGVFPVRDLWRRRAFGRKENGGADALVRPDGGAVPEGMSLWRCSPDEASGAPLDFLGAVAGAG